MIIPAPSSTCPKNPSYKPDVLPRQDSFESTDSFGGANDAMFIALHSYDQRVSNELTILQNETLELIDQSHQATRTFK